LTLVKFDCEESALVLPRRAGKVDLLVCRNSQVNLMSLIQLGFLVRS